MLLRSPPFDLSQPVVEYDVDVAVVSEDEAIVVGHVGDAKHWPLDVAGAVRSRR